MARAVNKYTTSDWRMNNGFSGDLVGTFEAFKQLTGQEMTKALSSGLRKAAKEIVSITKQTSTAGMMKRNNPHWDDGKLQNYVDKIEDAARHGKVWTGWVSGGVADDMHVNVSVFGSTAEGHGTYRFRFLEQGTKERYARHYRTKSGERLLLKKPRRLGRITPRWWFRNSFQSVVPRVDSIILEQVQKAINRINSANGK